MIKYEKLTTKEVIIDGKTEQVNEVQEVDKNEDYTYVHVCGHDKNPPEPCKRIEKAKWQAQ